jgi:hypothetical protein
MNTKQDTATTTYLLDVAAFANEAVALNDVLDQQEKLEAIKPRKNVVLTKRQKALMARAIAQHKKALDQLEKAYDILEDLASSLEDTLTR